MAVNIVVGLAASVAAGRMAAQHHIDLPPIGFERHPMLPAPLDSFLHVLLMLGALYLGLFLASLVLRREAFSCRETGVVEIVLELPRRVIATLRHAAPAPASARLSPATRRDDEDGDDDVVRQLWRALTRLPEEPPSPPCGDLDRVGPFQQSGHRVEVLAAV